MCCLRDNVRENRKCIFTSLSRTYKIYVVHCVRALCVYMLLNYNINYYTNICMKKIILYLCTSSSSPLPYKIRVNFCHPLFLSAKPNFRCLCVSKHEKYYLVRTNTHTQTHCFWRLAALILK